MMRRGCLLTTLVLAACAHPHYPPCAESIAVRSQRAPDDYPLRDDAVAAQDRYLSGCTRECLDQDSTPACVESELLFAEANPPHGRGAITNRCDETGDATACAWVAAHQGPPIQPASVDEYVSALQAQGPDNGLTLVSKNRYSLADGYTQAPLTLEENHTYRVVVVGGPETTFISKLLGSNGEHLLEDVDANNGLHVMHLHFDVGASVDLSPDVIISADKGDHGDVDVLLFVE
jgi:hypothetical protein